MKRILALILCCLLAVGFTACSDEKSEKTATNPTETTTELQTEAKDTDYIEKLDKRIDVLGFEGIVYLTQNGEALYTRTDGKDEKGGDLTLDTPMYIGSISKQFCAAAVMMLSEQGKLSVDDTLDKYFPEYEIGKDITIQNLLSMRSGIFEHTLGAEDYFLEDISESENLRRMKEWIFSEPLDFEPDSEMKYSNTNYLLLALIVEQVTGQHYQKFIRENIFEPVGMTSSGFIYEVKSNPDFSKCIGDSTFFKGELTEGLIKGAGDIVSTAHDMDKWMTALKSGKVISKESFEEMKIDRSPDYGERRGYGLEGMYKGVGHTGLIGDYWSVNFISNEGGYNLFAVGIGSGGTIGGIPEVAMTVLLG